MNDWYAYGLIAGAIAVSLAWAAWRDYRGGGSARGYGFSAILAGIALLGCGAALLAGVATATG